MTAFLIVCAAIVLGGFGLLMFCLLSANDTAAERHEDLGVQLQAIRAESEQRRLAREACADMRARS